MYLEDGVAVIDCADNVVGQLLIRRSAPAPRRGRDAVAHLLADELVRRHLQVLAHDVVHRHHDGWVEVGADVVERVGVDERVERLDGRGSLAVEVAVAHDADIGRDLGGDPVLVPVAGRVVSIPLGQWWTDGEYFDVGDFHFGCSLGVKKKVESIAYGSREWGFTAEDAEIAG